MNILELKKENDTLIEKALKIAYDNKLYKTDQYDSFDELLDKYKNYQVNVIMLVYTESIIEDMRFNYFETIVPGKYRHEIWFTYKKIKDNKISDDFYCFNNLFDFDDKFYLSIITDIDYNELIDLKVDLHFIEKCKLSNKVYMDSVL